MSAGSVCSFQSQGIKSHSSSNSSKRSKINNYKTVSKTSNVEENLFGEPNHIKLRKGSQNVKMIEEVDEKITSYGGLRSSDFPVNTKTRPVKEETVRVITKDMIRNLKVPCEDPSMKSVIMDIGDYLRLKNRSKVLTHEDILQKEDELKMIKENEMMESQARRQEMKRLDLVRKQNDKMTDLEEEAHRKAQTLLQKAMQQREEQEDEIKRLNELIQNAKIQAVRDVQILEKDVIAKEGRSEEERLDRMMEIDRVNAILIQEEIEKRRKEEELIAASEIIRQIENNEQEKLVELEKRDQENRLERERIGLLMEEEIIKRQELRRRQTGLRDELNRANVDMLGRREREQEQERLLDLRVLEIQREKAGREATLEAEAARIKADKEKEVARLRALQERASDEQAERDEVRARRAMEDAEREWRRKEIEDQRKKKDTEEELMRSRAEQADMKEHFLAIQAARDRAEFERSLRVQKEMMARDKEVEEVTRRTRGDYALEIRRQIRQNEEVKIAERNNFFKEGEKIEEEARIRRNRLEAAKDRKMDELKHAGIPEKFLKQIERKVQQAQKT